GYPDGLAGEDVPLLAQMLSVTDCFDALTSSRAYRTALPPAEAMEVLRAGAGTQFEPRIALAFLALLTRLPLPPREPFAAAGRAAATLAAAPSLIPFAP